MFAVGHFALGYLAGKGSSSLLKTKINLPLLLVVSVLPDIDLILQGVDPTLFMHRGPTHSIITFTVLMLPFFYFYRRQAIPYFGVLLSHSIIGDFFTGGIELFWPFSQEWFGLNFDVRSLGNVISEIVLFGITLGLMVYNRDIRSLLKPGKYNLVLIIALGAVLGPMISTGGGYEAALPELLVAPSLFWIAILVHSILIKLFERNYASEPNANVRTQSQTFP
jgi:membrane-bound metal-dependent hydrolase YbcI (DUF457 family)